MAPQELQQLFQFLWSAHATPEAAQWLRAGFLKWFDDSHSLPLERCLGLPTTKAKRRSGVRAAWLCDAARYIDAVNPTQGAEKLSREWAAFVARGPWRFWRDDEHPPADAPRLDRALFYATKYSAGNTLCPRHLRRIVGHMFTGKRQAVEPTLSI